jgi:ketosteroid isomerase-like protein
VKALSLAAFAVLTVSLSSFAADKKADHKMAPHKSEGGPDVAYMQKIMDAWDTLKTENVAGYYQQGPDHVFFDDSPLKYNGWAEYQAGAGAFLKSVTALKLTVNDDARIHREGDIAWGYGTVKEEDTTTAGKHEMATLRWTVIFEKVGDKWLIAHEHFSVPAS